MKKHILITGASSGLGKETAKKLADEGFFVFAGVRKEEDRALVEALHPNIKSLIIDVTKDESVKNAFEEVKKETQNLFALVNNAGIAVAAPVEFVPIELLKKQFEVNVYGAIRMAQTFLPLLENTDDARIVNISSMASFGIFPFVSPYCVSKRALDMFFNLLIVEAKLPNLKVISIKPGAVKTPIWDKSVGESQENLESLCEKGKIKYKKEFEFLTKNALKNNKKGLEPIDVANVVFKALNEKCPKSSYTVGKDAKIAQIISKLPQNLINFLVRKGLDSKLNSHQ